MLSTKTKKSIVQNITLIVFILYAISLLFPIFLVVLNSFKTTKDFFYNSMGFPTKFTFEQYVGAFNMKFRGASLVEMFGNSLIVVIGSVFINLLLSSMTAYVIAKYKFKCSNFIYTVAVIVMLIPTVGSLPATYKLLTNLKIINTFIGMFLMTSGFGFNFVLLYGYFKSISWSYAESAFIDGAGNLKTFLMVMLPQISGPMIALGIIAAIGTWNDYFSQYMFLKNSPTVAVGLQMIVARCQKNSEWPLMFSAMIITVLPVMILYISFNGMILKNTVAGGLKG